jgi:gamma-glutamylcyclotransferase (GGCT)/AIG2-like uncharacterized protein YtfP
MTATGDYFFYGTLMDLDVLARVLGRRMLGVALEPATVTGYRRVYARGAWYPVLVPQPGGIVEGRLLRGVNATDARRLARFEGEQYGLCRLDVVTVRRGRIRAWAFLPRPELAVIGGEPWTFDDWRRRFKPRYLTRVEGWMAEGAEGATGGRRPLPSRRSSPLCTPSSSA